MKRNLNLQICYRGLLLHWDGAKKYYSLEIISDVLLSLSFIRQEISEEEYIKILLYKMFQKLH